MKFDRQVNFRTRTAGTGHWSNRKKFVTIDRVRIAYHDAEDNFGELVAYFDPKEWDTDNDGLIYTDPEWMKNFKACMSTIGFSDVALNDISYSEVGMQGEDFVSMDVGEDFLRECDAVYRFVVNKQAINI